MIVTPAAATEPVEKNMIMNAVKKQRNCELNADAALTTRIFCLAFALALQRGGAEEFAELRDGE
jgi:hypothetical protein